MYSFSSTPTEAPQSCPENMKRKRQGCSDSNNKENQIPKLKKTNAKGLSSVCQKPPEDNSLNALVPIPLIFNRSFQGLGLRQSNGSFGSPTQGKSDTPKTSLNKRKSILGNLTFLHL